MTTIASSNDHQIGNLSQQILLVLPLFGGRQTCSSAHTETAQTQPYHTLRHTHPPWRRPGTTSSAALAPCHTLWACVRQAPFPALCPPDPPHRCYFHQQSRARWPGDVAQIYCNIKVLVIVSHPHANMKGQLFTCRKKQTKACSIFCLHLERINC